MPTVSDGSQTLLRTNPPQSAGKLPRLARIRARFLEGNDPVGDWLQIATVQTIP